MKFNMKKYFPVTALGLSLLLSGCADSFLEKSPSDYITSGDLQEVAKWNSNILMGQALGTYSTTFAMNSGRINRSRCQRRRHWIQRISCSNPQGQPRRELYAVCFMP